MHKAVKSLSYSIEIMIRLLLCGKKNMNAAKDVDLLKRSIGVRGFAKNVMNSNKTVVLETLN